MNNEDQVKSFRPSVHRILFPLAVIYQGTGKWAPARIGETGRIILTGDGLEDDGANMGYQGTLDESITSLLSDGVPSSDANSDFVVEDVGFEPLGMGYFSGVVATGSAGSMIVALPSLATNRDPAEDGFRNLRDRLVMSAFRTGLLGFKDRKSSKCEVTLGSLVQFSSGLGSYGMDKQGTVSIPTSAARAGQIADSVAGLRLSAKEVKDRIGFYVQLAAFPNVFDGVTIPAPPAEDPHPAVNTAYVVPVSFTLRGHYEAADSASQILSK